jgi:hypothetical protein
MTVDYASPDCPVIMNTPFDIPIGFDLVTSPDGTGTANGAWASVTWGGDQVQLAFNEQDTVLDGTIEQVGDAVTMSGTWTGNMEVTVGETVTYCPWSGTWEVTRTG